MLLSYLLHPTGEKKTSSLTRRHVTRLPACAVKPLQMVQNTAARLVFDQPKRAHVTPLFIELHWLPLAACIKLKSLMLAYKVLNGTAPIYLNALTKAYVTTRSLRSSQDCRLAVPPPRLKENSVFLKPRPYFLFEICLSTHREQFGEDRRPLRAI